MKTYTAEELKEIIELHRKWIEDEEGGVRANLDGASLVRASLVRANLDGASLVRASLDGASLDGASLVRARLNSVTGNKLHIKSIACEMWSIAYTSTHMQIGCQKHLISDWFSFDDEQISSMSDEALEWWKKWKEIIKTIIEMSPAQDTGYKKD